MKLFRVHMSRTRSKTNWLALWANSIEEALEAYKECCPTEENLALRVVEDVTHLWDDWVAWPNKPGLEERPELLRLIGFREECERSCDSCGLAPMGLDHHHVCDDCGQCDECYHIFDVQCDACGDLREKP